MANQTEVLRVLSTKEGAASPADLASELRADEATVRTDLNRLKKKGHVSGGGSQWYITDAGRAVLERGGGTTTKEDVGEDELSKFNYYGGLSGVIPDKVEACAELFQNTDMRSMDEMGRVLAEINVPQNQRTPWQNLYRGYLRNTTPPEERDVRYPLPRPEEVAPGEEGVLAGDLGRGESLNYIVEGNDILQVGAGLGMFTFKQALQVMAAKRGTAPQTQTGGLGTFKEFADVVGTLNPNKPMTVQDFLDIFNFIKETSGGGGEQPHPGYLIDEGELKELKPGQPIIVKKVVREPSKTYLLNPETSELEEHEAGKPIIIKVQPSPGSGSNMPPMMPFPVIGGDGQPVYDAEGKPVYANLEPMLKWMGFQDDRRRSDERHNQLMGLAQTVRENFGDGIAAIKKAAEEAGRSTGAKTPATQPHAFKCGDCGTQFGPPPGWAGQPLRCPNPACGREYSKEELEG